MVEHRLLDRARPQQRRRGEGQPVLAAPDGDEPGRALLHDAVAGRARRAAAPSQAWQVPSVGWPAKGSSATGVKIRTR